MNAIFRKLSAIIISLFLCVSLSGCFLTMYTPIETVPPTETEPKVEVYYLSKFSAEVFKFKGSNQTTEQDVIDVIDRIKHGYSYAGDCISFRISVDGEINLDIFEDLNYEDLYICPDPVFVDVSVRFNNIDMDALFSLAKMEEIIAIRIIEPLSGGPT